MIPTIGLLLCVYLVFKGIEILQIAIASPREEKGGAVALGVLSLIASILVAAFFAFIFVSSGISAGEAMQGIPSR